MKKLALFLLCAAAALPLAASFPGTVVDVDGRPLPDVQVQAFRPRPARAFREHRDPLTTVRTNSEGQYTLDVSAGSFVDLEFAKEGYAPAGVLVATDESAGTISLRRADSIEGIVTSGGHPVVNANVYVFAAADRSPVVTKTDAAGKYRVADPREWAQTIIVQHPDFAPAWHPASSPDFTLAKGKEIRGTVTDAAGRPAAGVVVDFADIVSATTDAEGKFTLLNAPSQPGAFLRARGKAGIAFSPLTAGVTTIKLQPTAHVSGMVRDSDKHPQAGLPLAIFSHGFEDTGVTDAGGKYAFEVPRGKYEIGSVAPSLYFGDEVTVDATAGDAKRDIVATRLPVIEGVVRTEDGKAVAGAFIGFLYEYQGTSWLQPTEKVTGSDGAFRMYAVSNADQKTRLVAVKSGMPPAMSDPLVASARASHVSITVPKGREISGRVVGKNGKVIAGVRVDPLIGTQRAPRMAGAMLPATQGPWATTNQDGRFAGRLTESTTGLTFAKKGYVSADQPLTVSKATKLEVTLGEAGSIAGKVVNKDGSPASDIMIRTDSGAFAMSGADGSFLVEGVEPGPQVVRFGRMSMQQQTVKAPIRDVTLVLAATRSVHGRVVDAASGAPIEKFEVSGSGADDYGIPTPFDSPTGEFKVEIPLTATKIEVEASGYVASKGIVVDPTGEAALLVKLSHGRTLRGRVLDENQRPVAGVRIGLKDVVTPVSENGQPETQADGSFEVTGLAFGEDNRVQFEKEGYVRAERKIAAGHDDATMEVVLRRGITVTGHVVDPSGAEVAKVEVTAASAAHGAEYETAQSDASGVFHFDTLLPAHYDFVARRGDSGERGTLKDVDIAKRHELTIQLDKLPTGTVFGHVTGLPTSATNRMVSIVSADGEYANAQIDGNGNFRAENVPAGTVEVTARTYGARTSRASKRVTIDVAAGSESRVDLAFPPQLAVHGRVLRNGEPLPYISVAFSGSESATAVTGPDGAYDASLVAGDYDVSVSASDGKRIPFLQHVAVNDAAEFDFRIDPITLNATVLDAETEQPVGGASLSASHRGETHAIATAVTAADGTTSLELSRAEILTVLASRSGFANASEDIQASGNRSIMLRLARTPGAVVRIVDVRNGGTLSGYVIARDASGRVVASASEADPDGTVTLPVSPGKYLFSASAEGFGSHTVNGEVPSGEIRIPLPRGGNLSIRSSADVRGTAHLIQPDGQEYVRCWCNGIAEIKIDNRATLVDRISPGAYTLEVKLADGKTKRVPVSIIEGQTAIVPID